MRLRQWRTRDLVWGWYYILEDEIQTNICLFIGKSCKGCYCALSIGFNILYHISLTNGKNIAFRRVPSVRLHSSGFLYYIFYRAKSIPISSFDNALSFHEKFNFFFMCLPPTLFTANWLNKNSAKCALIIGVVHIMSSLSLVYSYHADLSSLFG